MEKNKLVYTIGLPMLSGSVLNVVVNEGTPKQMVMQEYLSQLTLKFAKILDVQPYCDEPENKKNS